MARRQFSSQSLVLIVIAIAINMVGGQLISMLKLPIFLDSIGTLISAVLLGPVVGMLTGLLTNLLWGLLTDPIAAAFAPVAMVIGLVAAGGMVSHLTESGGQRCHHYSRRHACRRAYSHYVVWRRHRQRCRSLCRLDALGRPESGGVRRDHRAGREPGR